MADYSIGKSLVFASATLNPEENGLFRDLYRIMYGSLPRPGLIVYLHLPLERVRARIRQRGRSYEQDIGPDYLERLRGLYMDHLHKTEGSQVLVVDLGERDLLHDEDAFTALCQRLETPQAKPFDVLELGSTGRR